MTSNSSITGRRRKDAPPGNNKARAAKATAAAALAAAQAAVEHTISVPEAGKRYFGISKNASYQAAEEGQIPTIKVGRLLRVPVKAMERLLQGVGN